MRLAPAQEWTRLHWLAAASVTATVTTASLGIWSIVSEDPRVLSLLLVSCAASLILAGLLTWASSRQRRARVGRRGETGGGSRP